MGGVGGTGQGCLCLLPTSGLPRVPISDPAGFARAPQGQRHKLSAQAAWTYPADEQLRGAAQLSAHVQGTLSMGQSRSCPGHPPGARGVPPTALCPGCWETLTGIPQTPQEESPAWLNTTCTCPLRRARAGEEPHGHRARMAEQNVCQTEHNYISAVTIFSTTSSFPCCP